MRVSYLCVAALTTLSACSSSSGKSSAAKPASDGALDAGPYTIVIRDFVYEPSILHVPPGTTVEVIDLDVEAHSVTSESKLGDFVSGEVQGIQFDTGSIESSKSGSFTVTGSAVSGTVIPYFCTVHKSGMGEGRVSIE